jgi:hypothetical protein
MNFVPMRPTPMGFDMAGSVLRGTREERDGTGPAAREASGGARASLYDQDMLALVGPMLALAALPSEEPRRTMEELVENAERIVVARVERVHRLQGPDLLELAVERTFFGPNAARVFVLVPNGFASSRGAEVVAFLDPWRRLPEEGRVDSIVQGSPQAFALTPGALWPIENGRVDGSVTELVEELESVASQLDSLLPWLSAQIDASLPTIGVSRVTTGPCPWCFTVAPDGSIRGSGAGTPRLSPEALLGVWRTLEDERVAELPRFVTCGSSGPCASGWMLTVRTRAGRTEVTIYDGELSERTPPAERATAERAQRILAALPIAEAKR